MATTMWPALFLLVVAAEGYIRLDPLVHTKQGLIKGLRADDGDYSMFLGIPYGKVDAENPFGPAQPHPNFDAIFEAYNDSNICPQGKDVPNKIKTLDCLRLNIYVPNSASTKNKLPVLVWIHGGGFLIGSGTKEEAGPKFLIRHDIIIVSINYRLGPYGFMCLDIPEVSGNQGLKDQTMALKWIMNNIGDFGGDVNKITIYGESAGAASVEFHIVSRTEKLFDQSMLGSGSIFGRWTTGEVDNSTPLKLAAHLGYETDDVHKALSFLTKTDTELVVAAANEVSVTLTGCVEKEFESVEAFLTEHPMGIETIPKAKNINILSGYNSDEVLLNILNKPAEALIDPIKDFVNTLRLEDDKADEIYKIIRHFYIGDEQNSENVKWGLVEFESDDTFNHPVQRSIERFIKSGANSVYHYMFSYAGERNIGKINLNTTEGGAVHSDELGYVFDLMDLNEEINDRDQLIVDRMTKMWTNFIKYGNPTPETCELLPIQWPAVTKDSLYYMGIGEELAVGTRPFHQRLAFWDLFYQTHAKELL